MLGLQGLDVLIGLALMMFVVSLAASTIVEAGSSLIGQRGRQLQKALDGVVDQITQTQAIGRLVKDKVVGKNVASGGKGRFPSYITADTFADAVGEMLAIKDMVDSEADVQAGKKATAKEARERREAELSHPLLARVARTARATGGDPVAVRATVDRFFQEAMDRVSGAYKRLTMLWLFLVGLVLAIAANASVFHAAQALWNDTAAREAVVEASQQIGQDGGIDPGELGSVADTVDELETIGMPIGWTEKAQTTWNEPEPWWHVPSWGRLSMLLGWLSTAILVTLGAPFWFDLLQRLIAVRGAGKRPDPVPASTPAAPVGAAPAEGDPVASIRSALGV